MLKVQKFQYNFLLIQQELASNSQNFSVEHIIYKYNSLIYLI
jgi:hypothetical protein